MDDIFATICTFERTELTRPCVLSVIKALEGAEIHVVDDASTEPEMADFLKTLKQKGLVDTVLIRKQNIGVGRNRKEAMDQFLTSKKRYCVFSDSDIFVHPTAVRQMRGVLDAMISDKHPLGMICAGNSKLVQHPGRDKDWIIRRRGSAALSMFLRPAIEAVGSDLIRNAHTHPYPHLKRALVAANWDYAIPLRPPILAQHLGGFQLGISKDTPFKKAFFVKPDKDGAEMLDDLIDPWPKLMSLREIKRDWPGSLHKLEGLLWKED